MRTPARNITPRRVAPVTTVVERSFPRKISARRLPAKARGRSTPVPSPFIRARLKFP